MLLLKTPGGHLTGATRPAAGQYVPAGHGTGKLLPTGHDVPGGHTSVQDTDPAAPANVPPAHGVGLTVFASGQYDPGGHTKGALMAPLGQ